MSRPIVLAFCLGALAACSARTDEQAAKASENAQAKPKTVLDEQMKALEKAKAVQRTVDEAAKAQEKAIDENGG
ncbi:hypothetical protein [Dokdonella ginsengisoli]|uniref:Secreted protein n=1 Tax=Dokdonella ginsengisoli TaxID=363846 RepID=A0ABV9QWH7_9GAMM